jgi:hypothetical protein
MALYPSKKKKASNKKQLTQSKKRKKGLASKEKLQPGARGHHINSNKSGCPK